MQSLYPFLKFNFFNLLVIFNFLCGHYTLSIKVYISDGTKLQSIESKCDFMGVVMIGPFLFFFVLISHDHV